MELVKSELAFKDEETIKAHEKKVKDCLVKMMLEVHHPPQPFPHWWDTQSAQSAYKRSMYQCLRTTLVCHPYDLRGRRRAKKAMELLKKDIFKERAFLSKLLDKVCCGVP